MFLQITAFSSLNALVTPLSPSINDNVELGRPKAPSLAERGLVMWA